MRQDNIALRTSLHCMGCAHSICCSDTTLAVSHPAPPRSQNPRTCDLEGARPDVPPDASWPAMIDRLVWQRNRAEQQTGKEHICRFVSYILVFRVPFFLYCFAAVPRRHHIVYIYWCCTNDKVVFAVPDTRFTKRFV